MNITFRQLLYAVATARCASLSMAAEELHVSQPSLSSAIDQIEAQVGQKVFARRRGSGAALTPFGRSFIGQARRVLEEMRRLEHLSQIDSEVSGELVLGCFDDLAPYCAPALMRRLEERWPRLRLTVQEEGFAALQRRLADGTIDMALTYDLDAGPKIVSTVLRELRPHALFAANHRLAGQTAVSLTELAEYPLILSDQASSWQHMLDLFRLYSLTPTVFAKTRTFEMQRSLVANGFGVALVYADPVGNESYDGLQLSRRAISDALPPQRIVLARDGQYPATAAEKAVTEVALQWFTDSAATAVRGDP
jgi:DNA-binding transcriptional LysR family regulator